MYLIFHSALTTSRAISLIFSNPYCCGKLILFFRASITMSVDTSCALTVGAYGVFKRLPIDSERDSLRIIAVNGF